MPRKKTFPLCMHRNENISLIYAQKENISSIYAQKEKHFLNLCTERKTFH